MRIFAYGGSLYAERVRVGDWPDALVNGSDLRDLSGLPKGAGLISFGVGVHGPAAAFILRQRQNETDRGGYPYTVLIDPGEAMWDRFGWNAALFGLALSHETTLWADLLDHPERFATEQVLESRLGSLRPPPVSTGVRPERLHHALVAATLAEEPLVVNSRSFGIEARPSMEWMASALEAVETCFRTSYGWLVGAGPGTGASLGCRLIIDGGEGEAPAETVSVPDAAEVEKITRAYEQVKGISDLVQQQLQVPVGRWLIGPRQFFRTVQMLHELAQDGPLADGLLTRVRSETGASSMLDSDIAPAVLRRARLTPGPYSSLLMQHLLDHERQEPGALQGDLLERFDFEGAADVLSAQRLTAASFPHLALTVEQAEQIWARQIDSSADGGGIAALVADAIHAPPPRSAATWTAVTRRLAERGVSRCGALQLPLAPWRRLRDEPSLAAVLVEPLREASRAGVERRRPPDVQDYLVFAEDPDGAWLARAMPQQFPDVARHVTDLARTANDPAARLWLAELAPAAGRALIPLELKLVLADEIGGAWACVRSLSAIFEEPPRVVPPLAVCAEHAAALAMELEELVDDLEKRGHRVSKVPLDALAALLAQAPRPEVLDRILQLSTSIGAQNVRWLRERGHTTLYRVAVRQVWLRETHHDLTITDLDDAALENIVDHLLFGDESDGISDRCGRLAPLLSAGDPDVPRLSRTLAGLWRRKRSGTGGLVRAYRHVERSPGVFEALLHHLGPDDSQHLMAAAAMHERESLDRMTAALYAEAVTAVAEGRAPPAPFQALATFLLSAHDRAEPALARLGRTVLGPEQGRIRSELERLAGCVGDQQRPVTSDLSGRVLDKVQSPSRFRRIRDRIFGKRNG